MQADPGRGDRSRLLLEVSLAPLWRKKPEGKDVSIVACSQHKLLIEATTDTLQVSVMVVMDTESPVCTHRLEVLVSVLQRVHPDGARVHAAQQQLPAGAAKDGHTMEPCCLVRDASDGYRGNTRGVLSLSCAFGEDFLPEGNGTNGIFVTVVDRQEVKRLILPLVWILVLLLRKLTMIQKS